MNETLKMVLGKAVNVLIFSLMFLALTVVAMLVGQVAMAKLPVCFALAVVAGALGLKVAAWTTLLADKLKALLHL